MEATNENNLPISQFQDANELNLEELEAVDGGGVGMAFGLGMIGAGVGLIAGVVSGKSARESIGDAMNAGAAGAMAGAFLGPV